MANRAGTKRAPSQMDRPIPEECGIADTDRHLTCLGLLRLLKKDREKQRSLIDGAERRERWVLGETWTPRDPLVETLHAEASLEEARQSENLLYPLSLTYTARVNEGKVDPIALPVHPTVANVEQSDATNAFLEYERRVVDEDKLCSDGTQLAQYHGDVLFLPRWDPYAGPTMVREPKMSDDGIPVVDGAGELVYEQKWEYGATREDLVAAPDYWTDLVDDYDTKATYVGVRWVVPEHEARAVMLAAGWRLDSNGPKAHYENPADLAVDGVEMHEVWMKPGTRFAMGLHLVVCGECVISCEAYPEELDGELPGAVFKIERVRGSPRGKTHVQDALGPQKALNRLWRSLQARLTLAGTCVIAGPDEQVRQIPRGGIKRIPTQLPKSKDVRFISGDDVPAGFWAAYDRIVNALHRCFGINEATSSGGDPTQTKSGRQMDIAQRLDAQKFTPARDNLQKARKRIAIQKVEIARRKWTKARQVAVMGPDGVMQQRWLEGADIGGADVTIEIGSGVLNSRIAGMKTAEERGAAGLISPQAAAEESRTGLDTTVGDAKQVARIDAQAVAALKGQPQRPLPDVDPRQAADRLDDLARSPIAAVGNAQALTSLAQAYRALAQRLAGPQPTGGGNAGPSTPAPQPAKTGTTETAKASAQAQNGAVQ